MLIIRLYRGIDRINRDGTIRVCWQRCEHNPAQHRRPASLINKDMIFITAQDFLTTLTMRQHRTKIGLCAAGNKQCSLHTHQLGRFVL